MEKGKIHNFSHIHDTWMCGTPFFSSWRDEKLLPQTFFSSIIIYPLVRWKPSWFVKKMYDFWKLKNFMFIDICRMWVVDNLMLQPYKRNIATMNMEQIAQISVNARFKRCKNIQKHVNFSSKRYIFHLNGVLSYAYNLVS